MVSKVDFDRFQSYESCALPSLSFAAKCKAKECYHIQDWREIICNLVDADAEEKIKVLYQTG